MASDAERTGQISQPLATTNLSTSKRLAAPVLQPLRAASGGL